MPVGVVTLGQVAARLPVLEVACNRCNRCDRRGLLHTARLLAEHGQGLPMPDLRRIIAADCPRMISPAKQADSTQSSSCPSHCPESGKVVHVFWLFLGFQADRSGFDRLAISPGKNGQPCPQAPQ